MLLEEYDLKLMKLKKKHDRLDAEYDGITYQIDNLESKQIQIENEILDVENKISALKKQITDVTKEEINKGTGDTFKSNFIKASLFSYKDPSKNDAYGVKITENKIMAVDGIVGIIIKCDCIPENLKNTRIKWDTRENFADSIIDSGEGFYDLEKLFNGYKEAKKYTIDNMDGDSFYKTLNMKRIEIYKHLDTVELTYEGFEILFNKELLDLALMCMGNKKFTIYLSENKGPIVLENDEVSLVIMPMRRR